MATSCIASITLIRLKAPDALLRLDHGHSAPCHPAYSLDHAGKAWQIGHGGSPDAHAP